MNEDELYKFTMRKDEIIDNYIKLNKIMAKRITELDKEIEGLMNENIQMYEDIDSLNNKLDGAGTLTEMNKAINDYKIEKYMERGERIKELEKDVENLKTAIELMDKEITTLKEQNEDLTINRKKMFEEILTLKANERSNNE